MIRSVEIEVSSVGGTRRFVALRGHPLLDGVLGGDGLTGTETVSSSAALTVPAEPTVSLVIDLSGGGAEGFVTSAGRMYRSGRSVAARSEAWVSLTLTLPGAYRLLGGALGELDRPMHRLTDVLGPPAAELVERVAAAPGWDGRFSAMQDFVAGRALVGASPSSGVLLALRRLVESGGNVPVRTVADDVGWSSQHLVRVFRRSFGQPPKTLARLLRLRTVLRRVRAEGSWQAAAFDAGYYDQAHFARDLRAFTGTTPGRYVRAALPCGCVRQANSLQDPAPGVP